MTIMGIDPGTLSTGWAFVENNEILLSGTLTASNNMDVLQRSLVITDGLEKVVKKFHEKFDTVIDLVVIEDQYVRMNAKSALKLSRLVGMIMYMVYDRFDTAIYLSAPTEINKVLPFNSKQFRNRKKYHKAVVEHVHETYNIELTSTDEAFAILLALSHLDTAIEE